MTKANDLASLLDANGDVVSSALDNVPPSNDASALSTGTLPDGRFPATLPAVSGANLTGIPTPTLTSLGIANHNQLAVDGSGNLDVTGTVTADSVGVGAAPNATFGSLLYTQGTPAVNKPIVSAYSQGNSNNAGFALFNDSGNRGIWTTGSTMRFTRTYEGNSTADVTIDASGNLLVGQSATALPGLGNTTAGISLAGQYDIIAASRASGAAVLVNRNTDDGSLIEFSRNGSTVGAIGTLAGFLTVGTGDTGILFQSNVNNIQPINLNTNSDRDNAIDIGDDENRFKDLYLAGSISDGTNSKTVADIVSGGGKIVQYKAYTDSSTISLSMSGTFHQYTGYNVVLNNNLASTSNKIVIRISMNVGHQNNTTSAFNWSTSPSSINRVSAATGSYNDYVSAQIYNSNATNRAGMPSTFIKVIDPASTTPVPYYLWFSSGTSSQTYINASSHGSTTPSVGPSAYWVGTGTTTIEIMEIAQ